MKKYIFTESQIKSVIDSEINEQKKRNPNQEFWAPPMPTAKARLKDVKINLQGTKNTMEQVKKALQNGKFNITGSSNGAILNNKPYSIQDTASKKLFITPDTLIELQGSLQMSGMGMPECQISYVQDNNTGNGWLEFTPQYQ
jgi:hypothetical protein